MPGIEMDNNYAYLSYQALKELPSLSPHVEDLNISNNLLKIINRLPY